ncbi:MAG: hypothetical protein WCR63_01255 [Bacilli bacterium]
MNEKIADLMSIMELRIILEDSLEYIMKSPEAGFSKRVYDKRAKAFHELTKKGSRIDKLMNRLNEIKGDSKISVGEFISTQLEKCSEDIFDPKAIYLKEDFGAMRLQNDGLLEVMHVLIETNLNLGLLVDSIVSELYDQKKFPNDISTYLSYNEAYFYSYAAQATMYIFADYFQKGVEGKLMELEQVNSNSKGNSKRKSGLAQVAKSSVGIDAAAKLFKVLKDSYRIGDDAFIEKLNEAEKVIEPYDNGELIKTNFEKNIAVEALSDMFEDYSFKFKTQSKYLFNNIYVRYSD